MLDQEWYDARFGLSPRGQIKAGVDRTKLAAAERALKRPPLENLLDAIT